MTYKEVKKGDIVFYYGEAFPDRKGYRCIVTKKYKSHKMVSIRFLIDKDKLKTYDCKCEFLRKSKLKIIYVDKILKLESFISSDRWK